jgi:LPXTG-site transpeptidase (sortase) family protein
MGPRPGETGSAVIAGHYGWRKGAPAVFDGLRALAKGDKLFVEGRDGIAVVFIVRKVMTYGENDDASDVFGSSDGRAHLNLITCEGVWNKASGSYSNRLVVFADAE